EGPRHPLLRRLDGRRHAQVIPSVGRGGMYLHIVGNSLRIAGQLHCVQRPPWPAVNQCSTKLLHKARAHAFLDDAAYLDIARRAPVLRSELLWSGDDALRDTDSMPGMNCPAIAIAHAGTRLAVQSSCCIEQKLLWMAHKKRQVTSQPVPRD